MWPSGRQLSMAEMRDEGDEPQVLSWRGIWMEHLCDYHSPPPVPPGSMSTYTFGDQLLHESMGLFSRREQKREVSWMNYRLNTIAILWAQLTLIDPFLHYQALAPSSSGTTSTGFQDDLVIGSIPPISESLTSLSSWLLRLLYLSFYSHHWSRNHQEAPNWTTWLPHIVLTSLTFLWWSGSITTAKMVTLLLTDLSVIDLSGHFVPKVPRGQL